MKKQVIEYAGVPVGITIPDGDRVKFIAVKYPVIDLDGDGRAEVACKTADGTVDGQGQVIGDPAADWRAPAGPTVPSSVT